MDPTNIAIAVLAAISAGGVAYALIYPYLSGEIRGERRQAAVVKPVAKRPNAADRTADVAQRRKQVGESLKELEAKQKERAKVTLDMKIGQAGLSWTKQKYYIFSGILAVGVALTLLIMSGSPIMALLGGVAGAFGLPSWILSFLKKRRIKKFIAGLPDAMDVIVRGIKSGLPLGDCLRIIANEATEPVKTEFRIIVETQTLGVSLGEACSRLYQRIPVSEANFFGIVIEIQQKAGGNLSEAIGNLSRVLRARKQMRAKVSAMSMEAKASAAIIASLPFIVAILVYMSSPRYMEILWLTKTGKLVMAASGFWMLMGILAMKKMINFDI